MLLSAFVLSSFRRMLASSDSAKKVVKAILQHSGESKVRCRSILHRCYRTSKTCPGREFKRSHENQHTEEFEKLRGVCRIGLQLLKLNVSQINHQNKLLWREHQKKEVHCTRTVYGQIWLSGIEVLSNFIPHTLQTWSVITINWRLSAGCPQPLGMMNSCNRGTIVSCNCCRCNSSSDCWCCCCCFHTYFRLLGRPICFGTRWTCVRPHHWCCCCHPYWKL